MLIKINILRKRNTSILRSSKHDIKMKVHFQNPNWFTEKVLFSIYFNKKHEFLGI